MEQVTQVETVVTEPAPVEQKGVLGIPEKKFEYEGVSGDGNNNLPNPVKADSEDDEMEKSYKALRALVTKGAPVEEINQAFNGLGTAVEAQYAQKSNPGVDMNQLANLVQQAVAQAVQPLHVEIAALKSKVGNNVVSTEVVKSRALTLQGYPRPEDMIQKAQPPQKQMSQIQKIAFTSTGAIR